MAKLLGGMSLEEKLGQLTMIRADEAEVRNGRAGSILDLQEPARIHKLQEIALGETRLGIPLLFALDVLHGYDTIFPIPLAEAAAMDPALWEASAQGGGLRDGGGWDSADLRADAGRVARPALGADGGKSGRGPMACVALCGGQGPGISGGRRFPDLPRLPRPPSILPLMARSRPAANTLPWMFPAARCMRSICRLSPPRFGRALQR